MNNQEIVAIDVEVRGNCVVEIAAVSNRRAVYSSLVQPPAGRYFNEQYAGAGFSDELLADAPNRDEVMRHVAALCRGKLCVMFNAEFDRCWIPEIEESAIYINCVMVRVAPYLRDWNPHYGAYTYPKLEDAALLIGHTFETPGQHRALPDARAALSVWEYCEANSLRRRLSDLPRTPFGEGTHSKEQRLHALPGTLGGK